MQPIIYTGVKGGGSKYTFLWKWVTETVDCMQQQCRARHISFYDKSS